MKQNQKETNVLVEAEQLAKIMAETLSKLPPKAQFGFLQQIIGAEALSQMMQGQKPA